MNKNKNGNNCCNSKQHFHSIGKVTDETRRDETGERERDREKSKLQQNIFIYITELQLQPATN